MSQATTEILARATGVQLCDVVVIGVKPDGTLHIDWNGTTLGSLMLFLDLAKREALKAWDDGVDLGNYILDSR